MPDTVDTEALGEFASMGFTLEHDGDHIVYLMHEGESIARFSQSGASPESFQKEASLHLVIEHGWEGALFEMTPKK